MSHTEPDHDARSPWASPITEAEVVIHPPLHPPDGAAVTVPGSKSFTNRALILAAMAHGKSSLRNLLRSDDAYWCLDALAKLGVGVTIDTAAEDSAVEIQGTGGQWPIASGSLYMGAAGTVARFLPGALAASAQGSWRLAGSARLSERPIAPLVDALNALGARIRYSGAEGRLPLALEAQGLAGGSVTVSGAVSSQFISCLLLASPYARSMTEIRVHDGIVQQAYVRMTLDLMQQFGVSAQHNDSLDHFIVHPQAYTGQDIALEADASTSCYFLAYAALTGGYIRIANLSQNTRQPDIGMLNLFQRMGCKVEVGDEMGIELWGPADGRLQGGFTVSMREMSDQTLTVAALAPFADAPITITEVEHIRAHECDRIQAMCESLRKLGIQVEERQDGMTIYPGTPQPSVLHTYDDHRMAMSLALIGARVGGIRLQDPGCVSKTCPTYFDEMRKLGLRVS